MLYTSKPWHRNHLNHIISKTIVFLWDGETGVHSSLALRVTFFSWFLDIKVIIFSTVQCYAWSQTSCQCHSWQPVKSSLKEALLHHFHPVLMLVIERWDTCWQHLREIMAFTILFFFSSTSWTKNPVFYGLFSLLGWLCRRPCFTGTQAVCCFAQHTFPRCVPISFFFFYKWPRSS